MTAEQAVLAKQRAAEEAAGAAAQGGSPESGDASSSEADMSNDQSAAGNGRMPDGSDQRQGDATPMTAPRNQREAIPDGQDDDIVARQLREAAENETDPELQEKLWDEYRRYKNRTTE
jgi:hypothetical protein